LPNPNGGLEDCFGHGEIAAGALFAVRLRFLQQSHEHAQSNDRRSIPVMPLAHPFNGKSFSCGVTDFRTW
jgi:hypothetical protein